MEVKYTWQNLADDTIQIDIMSEIDSTWGFSLATLTNQLNAAKGAPVLVRLNSPGGSVVEGLAIANILNGYSGGVTVEVVGYAASIASVIVAKAKRATMAKDSFLMIHDPYVGVMGATADQLENLSKTAKLFEDTILNAYLDSIKRRKQLDKETGMKLQADMKAETWYTAQEALDLGLIDEIVDSVPTLGNVAQMPYSGGFWNSMKDYKNIPKELANKFNNINQENTMTKTTLWDQVKNLLSGVEAPSEALSAEPTEVKNEATEMTAEQMIEHLTANGYAVTTAEEAISAEEVAELIQNEVAAQVETIKAQLKADANKGKMNVPAAKADVKAKDEDSAFSPLKAFLKSKSNM
jgi:ATP-dependent protease ClpP protease subunit